MNYRILLVIASLVSLSFAQSGDIQMAGSLSVPMSGGTGTANTVWVDTTVYRAWQLETRKDDGKGPTVQQVDASAHLLAAAKLPSSRYRELALSIGLNPSPITDEIDILQAITAAGMKVYDWDRVDGYLYRKALRQKSNTRWVWKPLRESDFKAMEHRSWATIDHVGLLYPEQYPRAIPENVLAKVKQLLDADPNAVFLVSDYEVIKPDPFLAITTQKLLVAGKIWIVDRWDEPGYTDEGAEASTVVARR